MFRGRAPDLCRRLPLKPRTRIFEVDKGARRQVVVWSVCMGMEGEKMARAFCCHSGGNSPAPSWGAFGGEMGPTTAAGVGGAGASQDRL